VAIGGGASAATGGAGALIFRTVWHVGQRTILPKDCSPT